MKIIEKTPAVLKYVCEICNSEYESEAEAITCENYHINSTGLTSKSYESKDSKYPDAVNVRMADTSIQTYRLSYNVPNDIVQNVTVSDGAAMLALVESYKVIVKKEYTHESDGIVSEPISDVDVSLENKVLTIKVPDEVYVSSDMNICVKVFDKKNNEVTTESLNSPFTDIKIIAEVTTELENTCKEI